MVCLGRGVGGGGSIGIFRSVFGLRMHEVVTRVV